MPLSKWKIKLLNLKSRISKVRSIHFLNSLPQKRDFAGMAEDGHVKVLVFGNTSYDFVTYVNVLPQQGTTSQAIYREQCFGGKSANQCVAAAKLGGHCALIAKVGEDDLGLQYLTYLSELGINVEHVQRLEGHNTGISQIFVDEQGKQARVLLKGANNMLNCKDVSRAKKLFKTAKVLLCCMETDWKSVLAALKLFKGISILNASPASVDFPQELLRRATIVCLNRQEAAQLAGRDEIKSLKDAKAAANDLLAKGANSVIITMGSEGAVHLAKNEPNLCAHIPAAHVRYLADSSGAADAFLGSLAYHIAYFPNLQRESHIYAANICAAYSVGHRGTQPSFPGPDHAQNDLCQIDAIYSVISSAATSKTTIKSVKAELGSNRALDLESSRVHRTTQQPSVEYADASAQTLPPQTAPPLAAPMTEAVQPLVAPAVPLIASLPPAVTAVTPGPGLSKPRLQETVTRVAVRVPQKARKTMVQKRPRRKS